jgi:GNAT superfamily N-acetyltransferase
MAVMIIRVAREEDAPGFNDLAGEVEHWFGAMVGEPGFNSVLSRKIHLGTALAAASDDEASLLGGLLFTAKPPAYHVRWLVVSAQVRGNGIGRALMADAVRRFVTAPGIIEVVTFGADHPGAAASGARLFYERLGFVPGEAAPPGPEGGSRQVYRKTVSAPMQPPRPPRP